MAKGGLQRLGAAERFQAEAGESAAAGAGSAGAEGYEAGAVVGAAVGLGEGATRAMTLQARRPGAIAPVFSRVRSDALPGEHQNFLAPCGHSTPCGCENPVVATCCLDCPLPDCRFVYPAGLAQVRSRYRMERVARERAAGASMPEIAAILMLSIRSVHRLWDQWKRTSQT